MGKMEKLREINKTIAELLREMETKIFINNVNEIKNSEFSNIITELKK